MSNILDHMRDRVLLADGGMGTAVQSYDLTVDEDFRGKENCAEILCFSRPDIVRDIHRRFYKAGSDMVETNSFGGSTVTLAEFGLEDQAFEINKRSAELAREAADEFADGRDRFVIGSMGPGTKLPTLGHTHYDNLEAGYRHQVEGLVSGPVDCLLVETTQDPLQIKSAVNGARLGFKDAGREVPIFVQVTVETTGTMLVGTDIAAAATILHGLDVPLMGMNCATGPQEMAEHVRWMSENWPGFISVLPNAGLPELLDGETHYPLKPQELADWQKRFIQEDGINMIGGCCGTTDDHMAAMDRMLKEIGGDKGRPTPVERSVHWVPAVASLYNQVPYRQENAVFAIGERCNANGSKKFRELLQAEDWDGCAQMGRAQVKEGSHAIDVCTAFVGRDEVQDLSEAIKHMRGTVSAPLVIDSTETNAIEEGLKLYGGKGIINSINLEDGEEEADQRLALARKFGAGVIALTIDEEGMAKDADHKVQVAKRLYELAVNRHGLPPSDLLFDPLTFTICTGNEEERGLAIETLNAIERISTELPEAQIILGLSNVSFGLKPAARHTLNSVFLNEAQKRGMTGAIIHVSKIKPLYKIPEEEVNTALDLIYDRRSGDYDPLTAFIQCFANKEEEAAEEKAAPKTPEEALKQRIIDGDRGGIEGDLDEAVKSHHPTDIINNILLDGMKVVGDLFGEGKMQLPFVLQSAETMKQAVAHLEQYMEKTEGQEKGTMVLATVKGDVHDIGKNLVDIILTNNGWKVINLGIKQPVNSIIEAVNEHKPDAVGMSGLLVKSTVIMKENLEEMARQGITTPVLLGGAALTRQFVEEDCARAYGDGVVGYAKDAFDGLSLMAKAKEGTLGGHVEAEAEKHAPKRQKARTTAHAAQRPVEVEETKARRDELAREHDVPTPPFWGAKVLEDISIRSLLPFLNERMLFQFQWGFRKAGKSTEEFWKWAEEEVRPILHRMIDLCEKENILQPRAVYGYWKAAGSGNSLLLFDQDGETEVGRFDLPRQNKEGGLCIADFYRDVSDSERDVVALQAVTMGQKASEVARQWFQDNHYQDYLYLHGLSVELAEALAEYVHKRIRAELGYGAEDAREKDALLQQGYRGARWSFGYPACPNLDDQHRLLDLVQAQRVGIEMADEGQLHPEQSTSAIVSVHPQARYFSV